MAARFTVRVLEMLGAKWAAVGVGLLGAGVTAWFGVQAFTDYSARAALQHDLQMRHSQSQAAMAEHAAFTQALQGHQPRQLQVARGESLALLLARAGADWREINPAMAIVGGLFNPRRMRPGTPVEVFFEPTAQGELHLAGLAFHSEPGASVTVSRARDGSFLARQVLMPLTQDVARLVARVDGSISQSAIAGGATEKEVAALADVFAFDVDFQREVRPGDAFELVFERFVDEDGATVKTGEMLFALMKTRKGEKAYYRFQAPGDSRPDWYDDTGTNSRRLLMRTPVNGARLSSGFGLRRHPILGYSKLHKGVDFAAVSGTPVMAAGDGVVRRANRFGGYGNYVRLSHSGGYDTAYGHLLRFAKGVRPGARVRQGQIIAYVGSTGSSTGPHLHYEVLQRNRNVNPMSLKVATGRSLDGRALAAFKQEKQRIEALRAGGGDQPATLLFASASPGLQR